MGSYILRRLLSIIPFALLIVLLTLGLNQYFSIPSLDTETYLNNGGLSYADAIEKATCQRRKTLHQDWPIFYFSIQSKALPENLQEICSERERAFLEMLCLFNGNKNGALKVYNELKLLSQNNPEIDFKIIFNSKSPEILKNHPLVFKENDELKRLFNEYTRNTSHLSIYIPSVSFHLRSNQFNFWLSNVLKFDFGKSSTSNLPVTYLVTQAVIRTLSFTIPAVFIAFLLSIFLGLYIALRANKRIEIELNVLYFIDAIPLFWLSVLLITVTGSFYFTSESFELINNEGGYSLLHQLKINSLPILAIVLVSIPYITKQVYSSTVKAKQQAYIQTAIAKGITRQRLILNHILPNAIMPISVLFFNYIAFSFGGAFVVELVFSISGVGKLMADSIISNDFQVVSFILLYLILIKMILMILSDIVNYLLDPTLQFE